MCFPIVPTGMACEGYVNLSSVPNKSRNPIACSRIETATYIACSTVESSIGRCLAICSEIIAECPFRRIKKLKGRNYGVILYGALRCEDVGDEGKMKGVY